jgi:hypothetical protein
LIDHAATVGQAAVKERVARRKLSRKESFSVATAMIENSRKVMDSLRRNGIILDPPE